MVGIAKLLPLQPVALPGGTEVDVAVVLGGSAVGAFVSTLLVGGILIALAPEYTRRSMRTVREDIVHAGIDEAVFRDVDPRATAAFLLAAADGSTGFHVALEMDVGDDLRAGWEAYVDSLLVAE